MTIVVTNAIFCAARSGKIDVHAVPDTQIKEFSRSIRLIDKLSRAASVEELVAPTLKQMKAVRFALASTPLPGSWPSLKLVETVLSIEENARRWRRVVTDARLAEAAERSIPVLQLLSEQKESTLGATIRELAPRWHSDGLQAAVILKDPRYAPMVSQWLKSNCGVPVPVVLVPSAIRGCEYYDLLYIFGCPRWFRNDGTGFLFDAPRAPQIHVLALAWGGLELSTGSVFPAAARQTRGFGHQQADIVVHGRQEPMESDLADDLAAIAQFDIQAYLARRRAPGVPVDHDDEYEARLVQLAGNLAVLLDWDDQAASYCIDMAGGEEEDNEEERGLVCRLHNHELEEGSFIILRTGGGGDLVPVVADAILKESATQLRALETQWKTRLRTLRMTAGDSDLCRRLHAAGAIRATRSNLRNWIRDRTIRPDADADFSAILKTCDLEGETTAYFNAAAVINTAHRQAGFRIRKMLIAEVRKVDLRQLRQKGSLVFQLADLSRDASMTAYRIERIQSQPVMAQSHELGHPFQLEDELWQ